MARTARILSVTAATVVALATGTGTATPLMQWEGQWNPAVRLDTGQVMAPAAPTGDVDCWDDASCAITAAPPTALEPAPDMVGPDDAVHTGCRMLVGDDVTYVLCADGWTTES